MVKIALKGAFFIEKMKGEDRDGEGGECFGSTDGAAVPGGFDSGAGE